MEVASGLVAELIAELVAELEARVEVRQLEALEVLDSLRLSVVVLAEILVEVLTKITGGTKLEARVEIRQLKARVEIQQLKELEVLLIAVRY